MANSKRPRILSVELAASALGLSVNRIREICIANQIGWRVPGIRDRLLEQSDLRLISAARRPIGRPKAEKTPTQTTAK